MIEWLSLATSVDRHELMLVALGTASGEPRVLEFPVGASGLQKGIILSSCNVQPKGSAHSLGASACAQSSLGTAAPSGFMPYGHSSSSKNALPPVGSME